MGKREYLLGQLTEKIGAFKKESERHKNMYRSLRYSVFVLTATSSILAGLAIYCPHCGSAFNIAIVVVSASIAVVASIEGLRKPAELWIHERTTYYALMDLKREVEFKLGDETDTKMLEDYFFRMQKLLGSSGQKWSSDIVGAQKNKDTQPEAPTKPNTNKPKKQ